MNQKSDEKTHMGAEDHRRLGARAESLANYWRAAAGSLITNNQMIDDVD